MLNTNNSKILFITGDSAGALALRHLISQWSDERDCEFISAKVGQEALAQVLVHDFAAILIHLDLPGMNGFEAAEAIRLRSRSVSTPFIFIAASPNDESSRLRSYRIAPSDYLDTPVNSEILFAKLSTLLSMAKSHSELQAKVEQLTTANHQLELDVAERKFALQGDHGRDEFLAMLGHELRNPLSAITSAVSVLGFPGVPEDKALRARQIIQRQSQHLSRIVDDLLDLGRVLTGKVILNKEVINLSTGIENCLESFKSAGRLNGYKLQLNKTDAWIDADATRLEQIVTNLLDNALKYTPQGGSIDVTLVTDNDFTQLTLRDSGVGISAELLPHVFDVFVQGHDSLDRAHGGLGVGLSLVRQLVALHGGTIEVSSGGANCGSTFLVKLPLAQREMPELRSEVLTNEQERSYRVLLIEDNDDYREMMSSILTTLKHEVLSVADGIAGIALAIDKRPELAIIDIGLPGIDGYEIARRLRAAPETASIRLIALTGYGQQTDQKKAQDAGFDLHLVKPVEIDALTQALELCASLLI